MPLRLAATTSFSRSSLLQTFKVSRYVQPREEGDMKLFSLLTVWFIALAAPPAFAAGPFELLDGDRVVFLGNTLIEREQRSAYWETVLTIRYPHRRIQFRNLGWSGDTVFGEARAGFGTPADGFRQLKEHVLRSADGDLHRLRIE